MSSISQIGTNQIKDGSITLAKLAFAIAPGDNVDFTASSSDQSTAIQEKIDEVAAAGGGAIFFGDGTFLAKNIVLKSNVYLIGRGPGATILKLPNGSNVDLITSNGFSGLTGGNTQSGPDSFGIIGMTLDGNRDNNSSGWPVRVYGKAYVFSEVEVQHGKSGGVWSEWGDGGTDMEAQWSNVRIHDCDGKGLDWQGPHDSVFSNVLIFKNQLYGIHTRGNATSEQFTNCHVWGTEHDIGVLAEATMYLQNCQIEGASIVNIRVKTGNFSMLGGAVFGTGGANEIGLEIGDGTGGTYGGTIVVGTSFRSFNGSNSFALKHTDTSAGGVFDITYFANGAAAAVSGTFNDTNYLRIVSNDSTARSQESRINVYGRVRYIPSASTTAMVWKSSDGNTDHLNFNSSSQRMEFVNGTDARFFSDNYSTQTMHLDGTGYIEITESTAPSAPAANRVRLFAEDNGSGKTRLMARFNTGAAQQVAIEP